MEITSLNHQKQHFKYFKGTNNVVRCSFILFVLDMFNALKTKEDSNNFFNKYKSILHMRFL